MTIAVANHDKYYGARERNQINIGPKVARTLTFTDKLSSRLRCTVRVKYSTDTTRQVGIVTPNRRRFWYSYRVRNLRMFRGGNGRYVPILLRHGCQKNGRSCAACTLVGSNNSGYGKSIKTLSVGTVDNLLPAGAVKRKTRSYPVRRKPFSSPRLLRRARLATNDHVAAYVRSAVSPTAICPRALATDDRHTRPDFASRSVVRIILRTAAGDFTLLRYYRLFTRIALRTGRLPDTLRFIEKPTRTEETIIIVYPRS